MLLLFSAIIVVLIYFQYQNNESKTVDKEIHDKEIKRLRELQSDPILNEKYIKAEKVCFNLAQQFSGSSIENERQFKFKINSVRNHQIYAGGYISNGVHLKINWLYLLSNNEMKVFIVYENKNENKVIDETLTFSASKNENEMLQEILNVFS